MAVLQVRRAIAAPVAQVWPWLADVERWPQWVPTMLEVQALDGAGLAEGRRFRLRQPRLRPAVWTVTQVQAPGSFSWTTGWPGLRLRAEHELRSAPDGAELCLRMHFSGWLAPLLRPLLAGLTLDYMRQEAEALAQRCTAP